MPKNGITVNGVMLPKNLAEISCKCCGFPYKQRYDDGDEFVTCPNCKVKHFFRTKKNTKKSGEKNGR